MYCVDLGDCFLDRVSLRPLKETDFVVWGEADRCETLLCDRKDARLFLLLISLSSGIVWDLETTSDTTDFT